eukprot:1263210-Amphidinium_carterae.1
MPQATLRIALKLQPLRPASNQDATIGDFTCFACSEGEGRLRHYECNDKRCTSDRCTSNPSISFRLNGSQNCIPTPQGQSRVSACNKI